LLLRCGSLFWFLQEVN